MRLLVIYCVVLAIGGFASFLVADMAEQVDKTYGLLAFLTLFFLNLWVSWRIAIRLTGPQSLFGGT
jgi:hypothetical protein